MSKTTELLNEVKAKKGVTTDYALAKVLELPRGHICDYYKGNRFPNEFACLAIEEATGRSYEEVSAIVRIEAEKDENRRKVWKDYLKRIGGMAASIALLFFLSVTLIVTSTPAEASNGKASKAEHFVLCKILRILRRVSASVWNTLTSAFPHYGYLN